jgi:hypothetical protein
MQKRIAMAALLVSVGIIGAARAEPPATRPSTHDAILPIAVSPVTTTIRNRTVVDSQPDSSTRIMTVLEPGTRVTVMEKKGSLSHIKAQGVDGFVPTSALQKQE